MFELLNEFIESELFEVWEGSLVLREEICLFVYVGVSPD